MEDFVLALEEKLTQELVVQKMAGGGLGADAGTGPDRAGGLSFLESAPDTH
ncbi:hypothetical protein PF005_g22099 [Phytophthora fragariae]|nr:hypothetical protein PF003_g17195 [Phytophthora fragariae]KAE8929033.1 hypothetical protein PF009_g20844 [Phytophthora fragariae]KAE9084211.1 hypothetical protein PF007_g21603 [Phytophthora fragariae]KAE9116537.1 hypothetical protein PF006_g19017 [Phytophthora fragariae]KAE9181997.1 hypothetical protein PF004_g24371 [Phytophthora fragariae]